MRTRNTQQKKVLKHLHYYKGLTSFQAFKMYGITRLSAVIFDLKKEGHDIRMERITKKNEDGTHTTYGNYFLPARAKK